MPFIDLYTKQQTDALIAGKADAADVYTKTEADGLLSAKADASSVYTKTEADTLLAAKQDALTAGTGITISGNTIAVKTIKYWKTEVRTATIPEATYGANSRTWKAVTVPSGATERPVLKSPLSFASNVDRYLSIGKADISTDGTNYTLGCHINNNGGAITMELKINYLVEVQTTATIE